MNLTKYHYLYRGEIAFLSFELLKHFRTAHLAKMIGEALRNHEDKITKEDILCLEVAGLCHDLG